jgi:hypothetical protein
MEKSTLRKITAWTILAEGFYGRDGLFRFLFKKAIFGTNKKPFKIK